MKRSSPGTEKKLTHFDARGEAHMVDVADKAETHRIARARGSIRMQAATLRLIQEGTAKKGDVLGVARLAAIQAAKRTADLIPLAHPLALTRVGASGCASGIRSAVRFAAWIAARRATPSTSPFFAVPSWIRRRVAACMRMLPRARAVRCVSALSATSTICA